MLFSVYLNSPLSKIEVLKDCSLDLLILIFEIETCNLLDKIGNLIIYSSVLYVITESLLLISKNNVSIEFGFGPFLYLIALGLFFKVLSEVFLLQNVLKKKTN